MTETQTVQKQSTGTEERIIRSRELHEGYEPTSISCNVRVVAEPDWVGEKRDGFASRVSDDVRVDGFINSSDLSVRKEDFVNTLESEQAGCSVEATTQNTTTDDLEIIGPESVSDLEVGDEFCVLQDDKVVKLTINCYLVVTFDGPVGEEIELIKEYNDKEKAQEDRRKLQNASTSGSLKTVYDDGYNLIDEGSLDYLIQSLMSRDAYSLEFLIMYVTLYIFILGNFSTTWTGVQSFAIAVTSGLAIMAASTCLDYILDAPVEKVEMEKDDMDWSKSVSMSDVDSIEVDRTSECEVRAIEEDGEIVIKSREMDATWTYEMKDGVYPEEIVEFFENTGFELVGAEKEWMVVRASREKIDEDSIQSDEGEWYISPVV